MMHKTLSLGMKLVVLGLLFVFGLLCTSVTAQGQQQIGHGPMEGGVAASSLLPVTPSTPTATATPPPYVLPYPPVVTGNPVTPAPTPTSGNSQHPGTTQSQITKINDCPTVTEPGTKLSVANVVTGINTSQLSQSLLDGLLYPLIQSVCNINDSLATWAGNQNYIFGTSSQLTYDQTTVKDLWNVLEGIAVLILGVLWSVAGMNIINGKEHSRDAIPRLISATVLAAASHLFIGYLIDIESGLTQTVLQNVQSLPFSRGFTGNVDVFSLFSFHVNPLALSDLASAITSTGLLIMSIAVSFQMILRVGLLDFLISIAPLMWLLYGLPQTQKYANLYTVALVAVIFVQFAQDTAMAVGSSLLSTLGGGSLVVIIGGVAILQLVLRLPGWFGNWMSSTLVGVPTGWQVADAALGRVAHIFARK